MLVLDALRERPHPDAFLAEPRRSRRRGASRRGATYFTHMCHDLATRPPRARLPPGIELAYDGLVIETPQPRDGPGALST